METLLTTALFALLTLLFAMVHLRRSRGDRRSAPAAERRRCPRCAGEAQPDAAACPSCGVPFQIFEVVAAAAISAEPAAATPCTGKEHAVVLADRCVGCATCIAACPEPGALTMKGKLASVNIELCLGHGECVRACPVGGIVVGSGNIVQRIEVPKVGGDFQTDVPGLYIVGELGGRGLIKNAINEGRIAVESIHSALEQEGRVGDDSVFDVIIVGSGPAGLSAGLEAKRCGLRYLIVEQGSVADTIRKYPRHKLLLAEPVRVPLYGDLWVTDASKETLLEMWETIIRNMDLRLETDCRVESVARDGERLRVETAKGPKWARRVVLAMGRRGTPRRLDVPGENAEKVLYDVVEMEEFAGKSVLVVGGGDSAVESALGLANQKGTTVHLAHRNDAFTRVKERNLQKLEAAVAKGTVSLLLGTRVLEIREESVRIEVDGMARELRNDYVIVRIGGEPPTAFLEKVGVGMVRKDIPVAGV